MVYVNIRFKPVLLNLNPCRSQGPICIQGVHVTLLGVHTKKQQFGDHDNVLVVQFSVVTTVKYVLWANKILPWTPVCYFLRGSTVILHGPPGSICTHLDQHGYRLRSTGLIPTFTSNWDGVFFVGFTFPQADDRTNKRTCLSLKRIFFQFTISREQTEAMSTSE